MGNGDEKSGDGWKFRGRGYIQLTGKNNYLAFSKFIGEDCVSNPDLIVSKYPFESAFWFFKQNSIFPLCKDISTATITAVTKRINIRRPGRSTRMIIMKKYYDHIVAL